MKTLKEAYDEALKGIHIKENEAIIIASNDAHYCYYFAKYVKEANIEALQEAVIKSNDTGYCYYFAKYVEGADKQLLSEAVLKSLDEYYINKFYQNIDFDKTKYDLMLLFK